MFSSNGNPTIQICGISDPTERAALLESCPELGEDKSNYIPTTLTFNPSGWLTTFVTLSKSVEISTKYLNEVCALGYTIVGSPSFDSDRYSTKLLYTLCK